MRLDLKRKFYTNRRISVIHHFSMELDNQQSKKLKELQERIESKECEDK